MASEQRMKLSTPANFTWSGNALANGAGRQTTLIGNTTTKHVTSKIMADFVMGTTPTANTPVELYAIRGDGTIRSDGAGASDAAWTQKNAKYIGSVMCTATTTGAHYYGDFDWPYDCLGDEWGVGVMNKTGVALGSGSVIAYQSGLIEAQ